MASVWTEEEIGNYRQLEDPTLDSIYEKARLSNNPEDRAKYLAEEVLDLTMTDHDLIMRTAAQEGRPAALNLLERIAIESRTKP